MQEGRLRQRKTSDWQLCMRGKQVYDLPYHMPRGCLAHVKELRSRSPAPGRDDGQPGTHVAQMGRCFGYRPARLLHLPGYAFRICHTDRYQFEEASVVWRITIELEPNIGDQSTR